MIKMYTKAYCSYCDAAKGWFRRHEINFDEVSLDNPELKEEFVKEHPGLRTVPQIFLIKDGVITRIGGYTDLLASQFAKEIQNKSE